MVPMFGLGVEGDDILLWGIVVSIKNTILLGSQSRKSTTHL